MVMKVPICLHLLESHKRLVSSIIDFHLNLNEKMVTLCHIMLHWLSPVAPTSYKLTLVWCNSGAIWLKNRHFKL